MVGSSLVVGVFGRRGMPRPQGGSRP